MAQYLSVAEWFEEGEKMDADSHVNFYEWMQRFQDISAAKRILEVETNLELYKIFKNEKYEVQSGR